MSRPSERRQKSGSPPFTRRLVRKATILLNMCSANEAGGSNRDAAWWRRVASGSAGCFSCQGGSAHPGGSAGGSPPGGSAAGGSAADFVPDSAQLLTQSTFGFTVRRLRLRAFWRSIRPTGGKSRQRRDVDYDPLELSDAGHPAKQQNFSLQRVGWIEGRPYESRR